jgi:hypothetical protein
MDSWKSFGLNKPSFAPIGRDCFAKEKLERGSCDAVLLMRTMGEDDS